mmetsp:Transcript_37722/g.106630  ORF Transcript_37722/g.106630 Transcript_37722/m.106630 type:complete len:213 (+) Transcript_37722:698-1336(+)
MSWTTLPLGPLTQPTYLPSRGISSLVPMEPHSMAPPDWSETFMTSATTRPYALLFSSSPPWIFTTQWPRSLVVWSMSTIAPLRPSISRIMAPCLPFSQPTQVFGMRTWSHSPVSPGSTGLVAFSAARGTPPLPDPPAAAEIALAIGPIWSGGLPAAVSRVVTKDDKTSAASGFVAGAGAPPGSPSNPLSRSVTLASSLWMNCFAASTAASEP